MASRTGQGGRRGAPTHRSQPVRCGIGQPCAPTALTRNRRVSAVVRAPWDSCVIRPASAATLAQTSVSSGPGRALGPSCGRGRETQREREREIQRASERESARERDREREFVGNGRERERGRGGKRGFRTDCKIVRREEEDGRRAVGDGTTSRGPCNLVDRCDHRALVDPGKGQLTVQIRGHCACPPGPALRQPEPGLCDPA